MEPGHIGWMCASRRQALEQKLQKRLQEWCMQWRPDELAQASLECPPHDAVWPVLPQGLYRHIVGDKEYSGFIAWCSQGSTAEFGAGLLGLAVNVSPAICARVGEEAIDVMVAVLGGQSMSAQPPALAPKMQPHLAPGAGALHATVRVAGLVLECRATHAWSYAQHPRVDALPLLLPRQDLLLDTPACVSVQLSLGKVGLSDMATLAVGDVLLAETDVAELLSHSDTLLATGRVAQRDGMRALAVN